MATELEDLRILQTAEGIADAVWKQVVQFLYYSRGSLFETKYWLNRAQLRKLMQPEEVKDYAARLSEVARQLNSFASSLKSQRKDDRVQPKSIREPNAEYAVGEQIDDARPLFAEDEFTWLES